ncbi:EamA family transporter [Ensifer adhaerens]|uniref:DMT family transporter n=1 Tax=Ensifer adhaerens TaxID=106592 RepID=UPI0023A95CF7|nr:EamA family transporter [Ensifer adhaerens]WDZ75085.1 EamA family transporter [Ensifer adhaerens]
MTSKNSVSFVGFACVLLASALWGTTGTTATFASGVSPLGIGAVAMGFGGLLLALTALHSIVKSRTRIAAQWPMLVLGSASVAIYPLAFYSSMHLAGVAIGTVISIGSAPLAASLIERFFDGQKLTTRWLLGAAAGLAGAVLLTFSESAGHDGANAQDATAVLYGILLGLVSGLLYALYSWVARRLMQAGIPPRAAMGSIFGVGGLALLPVLAFTGAPLLASWTNIAVGVYMALVPVLVAYVLFAYGLARVSATMATTLSLLEPVIAAVLAVVIVGERLPAEGWIGIGLIVGSLFILTLPIPGRRRRARPERSDAAIDAALITR